MSRQEVLKLYGVKMLNEVRYGHGEKTNAKSFTGNGELGTYFDISFNTPKSLQEDVIDVVDHFINGNNPEIDSSLGGEYGCFAVASLDGVRFHNPNTGKTEQIIPLEHFKIIAEAWRDFLLTPPLAGEKILSWSLLKFIRRLTQDSGS